MGRTNDDRVGHTDDDGQGIITLTMRGWGLTTLMTRVHTYVDDVYCHDDYSNYKVSSARSLQ